MQKYKIILFSFAAAIVSFYCAIILGTAENWQELKGEHFLVYYTEDRNFAGDLLYEAEKYYKQIAHELGYQRYSNFWTWKKRVKIYVYPDKDSYIKNTGAQSWSEGLADYANKAITSYAWNQNFLKALLPHEIAHLIFRDFVGFKGEVPVWLDEGVAQWMETEKREVIKTVSVKFLEAGKFWPVSKMTELDPGQLGDKRLVEIFYIQSVSVVGFLMEQYGGSRFADFCRRLRDGESLNKALPLAYPASIGNIELLEGQWRKYIKGE